VEKYSRAGQATDGNIIWHMHVTCWISEATYMHPEYVILTAFPWQQWLYEYSSILCYIYIACLVFISSDL
jgi:hypothetical protein